MITVISGTNRKGSMCKLFAEHYAHTLQQRTSEDVKFLALEDIPHDWFHAAMYGTDEQSPSLTAIQDEYILPAKQFIIFSSEYNGSFPGVLKMFIDACSIREYASNFKGKKIALIGVASGRAGNLRGMEHLTGIFNYLGTLVMPNRLPISSISSLIDKDTRMITDTTTLEVMATHQAEFLRFIGAKVLTTV